VGSGFGFLFSLIFMQVKDEDDNGGIERR